MKEYIAKESKIRNSAGNIDYGYLDIQLHKIVGNMIMSAEYDGYKQGRKEALNEAFELFRKYRPIMATHVCDFGDELLVLIENQC